MPLLALLGVSVVFGLVAWSVIAMSYLWPALKAWPRAEALRPLLMLHSFRFVGLSFLVPGVVSPEMPPGFAVPAAYGDLIAASLALASLAMLRVPWLGLALVWALNLWGATDLFLAFYNAYRLGLEPGQLGAAFVIPTVVVPLLLVTHALMFMLLLRKEK